jgi:hypothetical protein
LGAPALQAASDSITEINAAEATAFLNVFMLSPINLANCKPFAKRL